MKVYSRNSAAQPGELEYWDDAVLPLQQGEKSIRVVLGVDAATDYILGAFQVSRHTVEPEYIIRLWKPADAYAPVLSAAKSAPRHGEVSHG
ncbi:MAG: hypothetical protein GX615_14230 [Lentisphaerae bacterium]|nr:hypothetical protein [Lentisphaerota bacterium]